MTIIRWILKFIDSLSEAAGSIGKWFALVLVAAGTYETISRHFFGSPTIWAYDTLSMAGGILYLLGASFDYKHNAHTRVDIIYSHLKPRVRVLIDIIASLVLFFPLMTVLLWFSFTWTVKAWKIGEVMFTSFWYPPAGPYRTVFTIGLLLLVLQGVAQFIRDIHFLVRGTTIDQP
ncbi:MAG: TRAP transporter small permease subunit [Spirochaetales bacterium]|nr:TRAP transporter small permease subunit [Spirochaetales bacterium]